MKNDDKGDICIAKPKNLGDDDDDDDDDEDDSDLEETSKALGKKPKRKIYSSDEESEDELVKAGKKIIFGGKDKMTCVWVCRDKLVGRLMD